MKKLIYTSFQKRKRNLSDMLVNYCWRRLWTNWWDDRSYRFVCFNFICKFQFWNFLLVFGFFLIWPIVIRYLFRFFDCLAHPNLSATFATDQKWPICHLRISYQSLAGGLRSLQKSKFLKLIISIFHVKKWNN